LTATTYSAETVQWKNNSILISMQIRLWESDRNRVEMIPSHLYEDFPSKVNTVLSVPYIFVQGRSSDIYLLAVLSDFSRKLTDYLTLFPYVGMV
jgi:hypothetical protein